MEKEEWREIKNYPNYMISNRGRVKSLNYNKTGEERIMKFAINKKGYCCVVLYKDKKQKHYLVHRLVATAFIPNPNNLPQLNHKDEVKTNNCVDNLEWCDAKYNINYGTHNNKLSLAHKGKKLSQEHKDKLSKILKGRILSQEWKNKISKAHQIPILQFSKSGNTILRKWDSATQASNELNINRSNITKCCNGKHNFCGGYRWMYYEDYVNKINNYINLALKEIS